MFCYLSHKIAMEWLAVKGLLRVMGARTKEALVEAIGKALDVLSAWDARGFFTHCGYGGLEQQL